MGKFAKWIGGGLGWAFGGPIGAVLGFAIGSAIDRTNLTVGPDGAGVTGQRVTGADDFSMSLLVLSAAVMKADGKVLKSELEYVKKFFVKQFGTEYTKRQMKILKELLEKDIPLHDVCTQIKMNMQHSLRLQLMHYLFGISQADGVVHSKEVEVIRQIARYLGISQKDFESIEAMFYQDIDSAYKVLEVEKVATDDQVKKAYRRMAVKHHPDKVSQLGEEFQKAAKEKFQKIQDAYEAIKKERGMK